MINPAGSLNTFQLEYLFVKILNLTVSHHGVDRLSLMLTVLLWFISALRVVLGSSNNVNDWDNDW
jgi:hypothetical protein